MSKNPVSKSKPAKGNEPLRSALRFFVAGCVAELYLLLIRRFYVNGTVDQLLACDEALPYLMGAGAAVAVVGLVLGILWRQIAKRRWIGWSVCAAGVFLGGSAWMIRTFYDSALTFLCVVVPVAMLLGILWNLYDRECAWSLTILGVSPDRPVGVPASAGQHVSRHLCEDRRRGLYRGPGGSRIPGQQGGQKTAADWEVSRSSPPVRTPCPCIWPAALSIAALAVALFSSVVAYYAMWALAIVVFALAVYYTVKQL